MHKENPTVSLLPSEHQLY